MTRTRNGSHGERPAGLELVALALMGIGGLVLPLVAPAVGVALMMSTRRWTPRQVRACWLLLAGGLVALAVGAVVLAVGSASVGVRQAGLALMGVAVVVGPAAALYAATRPRGTPVTGQAD